MSNVDVASNEHAAAGARSNADKALSNLFGRSEVRPAKNSEAVQHGAAKDGDSPNGYDLTNPNLHYGTRTDVEMGIAGQDPTSASPIVISSDSSVELSTAGASTARANQTTDNSNPIVAPGGTDESQLHAFDASGQLLAHSAGHASALPAGTPFNGTLEVPAAAVTGTPN